MAEQNLRERYPQANLKLDHDQLRIVEKVATLKSYKDGETIIEAGTHDPNFYVVKSGQVDVIEYSTGKPLVIWTSDPKEVLGDVSFLSGRASNLSRVAKGDADVLEIRPENLRRIIDEEATLGTIILATLIAQSDRQTTVREERTRIARELHDTFLQTFLSALMQLGVAVDSLPSDSPVKPRLDRILRLMDQGIEEGRNTVQGLRSPDSRAVDLVLAFSQVRQEIGIQPEIDFRVVVTGQKQPLRSRIANEVYRIGREALVNAFRHSGAKRVELELEYTDTDLCMRVRDDGCGIDPRVLHAGREGHWGLTGMRERATRIGAKLKVSSSAAHGTEVHLSVPYAVAL